MDTKHIKEYFKSFKMITKQEWNADKISFDDTYNNTTLGGSRKILKSLREAGMPTNKMRKVGSGLYAQVWKKDGKIIKVTSDIAYVEYARISMENYKTNHLFPEIYSIKQVGEYFVIEMKMYRLVEGLGYFIHKEIYGSFFDILKNKPYYDRTNFVRWRNNTGYNKRNIHAEECKEWFSIVKKMSRELNKELSKSGFMLGLDLHNGNIMRDKGYLVVTDPLRYVEL